MPVSEALTKQRRELTKLWLAHRVVIVSAVVLVVVVLVGLFAHDAWTRAREASIQRDLEAVAHGARERVRDELEATLRSLDGALDLPRLAAVAATGDAAAVAAEAQSVRAAVPAVLGMRLLKESDRAPDYDSVPPVTYAAQAMLREAIDTAENPPPEVLLVGKPEAHVAVLRRLVDAGGATTGHLLVGLDAGSLLAAVLGSELPPGSYLELVQGVGSGQSVMSSKGNTAARIGVASVSAPVPGTRLSMMLWPPPEVDSDFADVPLAPLGWGALAVLVALALLALVRRRGRRKTSSSIEAEAPGRLAAEARALARAANPSALDPSAPLPTVEVEEEPGSDELSLAANRLSASIFRAYDVRGVVDESLTEDVVRQLGLAIGSEAYHRGQQTLVVGADGRLSSPKLSAALVEGLRQSGRDVIDVGRVPTPVVYFATHFLETASGVMVTGSHNPPQYNGMKIMLAGDTLFGDDIQALRARIEQQDFTSGAGHLQNMDVSADYIRRVSEDVPVALGNAFKVVVDCGNGIAGDFAPKLIRALGHDVVELHCEVDGKFPNHHPDPSQPENLADLIRTVEEEGADIGFAFDGDGDRLGVVDGGGNIIWPDTQMMLYARDVLSRNAGAQIVFDVKCSSRLAKVISRLGGKPVMFKTGHSFIKNKLKETGAPLAGEMSGHIFFKERWYGFDDALYTAARMLEILMGVQASPTEVFAKLPTGFNTPELRVDMNEGENLVFMEALGASDLFEGGEISTIDGVRVDWDDCWGLVRASNTTPSLVLRFEGDTPEALERVKKTFREVLHAQRSDLVLPF